MSHRSSRRDLLAGAAAAGAGLFANGLSAADAARAPRPSTPRDPTKLLGRDPSELGERSAFVAPRRPVGRPAPSGDSETPLHLLNGIVTPADLHYERHHAGVPSIDPERYSLLIHGMVERPTVFALRDLQRFPSRSELRFLECSGNGRTAYMEIKPDKSPQQLDGLTSTSEWTGVPLRTLFDEVGVKPGASWFLAESCDACVYARSIPLDKGLDDAMIAYGQNGEPLRPEQGYPARLFLPGWEGSTNIKWIRRIEVADQPFMTREETSKYSDPLADGTARLFSFVMDAKSVITFPTYPALLPERGFWEISGLAWSGRGRVVRVDVSCDGGRAWRPAELQEPVLPKCHTRFRFPWQWDGREALLMSRASDETGYIQPTLAELRKARGPGTSYHFNHIRAWRVHRDGRVTFGLEG
jgi:sulfane dehydrogenase subunit SoxC